MKSATPMSVADDPSPRQAPGAEAAERQGQRQPGARPGDGLVDHQAAALPEAALQQRGRPGDHPAEDHRDRHEPDDAGRVRGTEQARDGSGGGVHREEEQDAARRRDRVDGAQDGLRVTLPADDGQADAELVEAEHREERHHRHGERAELPRPQDPGHEHADDERAQPGQGRVEEAPAERAGRRACQAGVVTRVLLLLLLAVLRPHARTPCCVDVCPLSADPGPDHGDVARKTTSTK